MGRVSQREGHSRNHIVSQSFLISSWCNMWEMRKSENNPTGVGESEPARLSDWFKVKGEIGEYNEVQGRSIKLANQKILCLEQEEQGQV